MPTQAPPARGVSTPLPSTSLPGPRARALLERGHHDMQSIYRSVIFDAERSLGTTLVDVDGNGFLDLFSSFALGALGYNHPALLQVARSDAFVRAAVNPTSTPFLTSPEWLDFADEVERDWAPAGMSRIFCVDSGGEGVDSAIKAAFIKHGEARRVAEGLPADPLQLPPSQADAWMANQGTDAVVISFDGAFHGRGLGPLSATHSKLIHKADLPAFPWPVAPFPAQRWPLEQHQEENERAEQQAITTLIELLEQHAGRVAAVLVEPVQSEGGDRHAAASFFRKVRALTAEAGAALILDEVQTGTGISGSLWCHSQFDLPAPPDLVTFGKKMQLGGFFAAPSHDIRQFGRMYQTRNGDRARAMLALATLRALRDLDLLRNVRETGALFLQELQALERAHPRLISQARGRGFLLAFDLPTPAARDELLQRCLQRGVFASYTGSRSVRLRPHLVTTPAEVTEAMAVFHAVARELDI